MPTSRFRHARNPLTLFGIWLTTVSAVLFLVVFLADVFGVHTNPYIGILFFLVLPALFVFGLVLIPAGIFLSRRRERLGRPAVELHWPVIDLNVPHQRRVALFIAAATVVNIVVLGLATYRGVEYMDSPEFCGQVCHTVMKPEFTAYLNGPHARVACVQCHIGPGAPWFVKSKLSGTRQLFAVALETYPTPIPSPVENLRPARDTCEQCHWPEKFTGDRLQDRRRVRRGRSQHRDDDHPPAARRQRPGEAGRRRASTGTCRPRFASPTSRPTPSARPSPTSRWTTGRARFGSSAPRA